MPTARRVIRFRVDADDGRHSQSWLAWTGRRSEDVYLAPEGKAGEFKVSLHQSGKWRLAFTEQYAPQITGIDLEGRDRVIERLTRPNGAEVDFARAVRIHFLDGELRCGALGNGSSDVVSLPSPPRDGTRIVDLLYTTATSRFGTLDPPLSASLGAEVIAEWHLAGGDTVWIVHFQLNDQRELGKQVETFRAALPMATKLDRRHPLPADAPGTTLVVGVNDQGWFTIIEAALA